jgi:tRNA pseudouridine32 synthase / 23S rRNA pseudouridine746 synthase
MSAPLPPRDGVGASSVWLPEGPWETVLEFLTSRFPGIDAPLWIERMENGDVVDQGGARLSPTCPYRSDVRLYYYRAIDAEFCIPDEEAVLHRDDQLLVVDKPHFLPVMPAGRYLQQTLLVRLKQKLKLDCLAPLHRIDRETAGIVLFSLQPENRGAYHSLFQQRQVRKTYEAVARSLPGTAFPLTYRSRLIEGQPFFRMQETSGAPNAETHIDVLQTCDDHTLYQLTPVTGRKHQLRVHMASLGIPIVNDSLYPALVPAKENDFSSPLQLLAKAVAFVDPLSGEPRRFESRRRLRKL